MALLAKDLRIGNAVSCTTDEGDGPQYFSLVCAIRADSIDWNLSSDFRDGYSTTAIEYVKGIELSEDLLLRCGFEKGDYHGNEQWLGPWIKRFNPTNDMRLGIMKDMFGYYYAGETFAVRLNYLHTLMNLYFIMTGEELTLQP